MNEDDCKELQIQSFIFDSLLDNINAILYVSDIETNEILYMSKNMQRLYNIEDPEGQPCWQVFRQGVEGRCPFCPVPKLLEQDGDTPFYVWEECSTLNGHIYENYDSLVRWTDGRLVHLQHSVDITEFKQVSEIARTDELTGMMNRRAGKQALKDALKQLREDGQVICACLYDMNGLKQINDNFGHHEGDRSISYIAQATLENMGPKDFSFRLSGDEFVIVFIGIHEAEAKKRVQMIQKDLKCSIQEKAVPHEVSFCYGVIEITAEDNYSVSEVLSMSDEQMYQQKREYHIQKAAEKLKVNQDAKQAAIEAFNYNKDYLYEALIRSTDHYVYVGNMKTGTFRYSPSMVEEFGLPGPIIPNAAAVWGMHIHPDDKKCFLAANQEIADGRVSDHDIVYRAKDRNGKWVWLRCRGYLILDKYELPDLFAGFISRLTEEEIKKQMEEG